MSQFTTGNAPGFQAAVEGTATQLTWSGREGQDQVVTQRAAIHADTVDAGNTPTTTLRAGVVLAYRDTDGKVALYSPGATDGTQVAVGVLEQAQDMLVGGVATERFTQMIVHGLVRENLLQNLDAWPGSSSVSKCSSTASRFRSRHSSRLAASIARARTTRSSPPTTA